ncbi:MAG: PaaI family thioesterase [Desulfobacterales bacterium]|nr:PaaI family thioesterase [Desulfobacterales bacterium]
MFSQLKNNNSNPIRLPRYSHCFVCGKLNPVGLDLQFFYINDRIESSFIPKPEHGGYKNKVHGGILATLLDESMGWTSILSRPVLCVAADLSVRYKLPARVGEKLVISAELLADKKRLFLAKGKIEREDGTTLCTGEGKYMPLSSREMEALIIYAKWEDSFYPVYEQIQALRKEQLSEEN